MTSTNTDIASSYDPVPVDAGRDAVEAWFAGAGVKATVVARCPDPSCPVCRAPLADAA